MVAPSAKRWLREGAIGYAVTFLIAALQIYGVEGRALPRVLFAFAWCAGAIRIFTIGWSAGLRSVSKGIITATLLAVWSLSVLLLGRWAEHNSKPGQSEVKQPLQETPKPDISGTVLDGTTQTLLRDVDVSSGMVHVTTDSQGLFDLPVPLPEGHQITLHFNKPGYISQDETVFTSNGIRCILERAK